MENLIYSMECVLPCFVMIFIGYVLRRCTIIDERFVGAGTDVIFKIALPVLLFTQIAGSDLTEVFNPSLIAFSLTAAVAVILLLCITVPVFVKDNAGRGAMIQGIFRGNFAILGVPIAISMFGEEGALPTTLLLPFVIPVYNVAAVVILTLFDPSNQGNKKLPLGKIVKGILTNPLIIGILLALPFALTGWQLPGVVDKSLDMIASLTTPLSFLCLGGQFTFQVARDYLGPSLTATAVKQLVIPAVVLAAAVLTGYRGEELGAVFILFMAPSAVSSYIMAKNMNSDDQLAAQILILTTFVSCFTMTGGIYLLRSLGLI